MNDLYIDTAIGVRIWMSLAFDDGELDVVRALIRAELLADIGYIHPGDHEEGVL